MKHINLSLKIVAHFPIFASLTVFIYYFLIILGSLAKGTPENVSALVEQDVPLALVEVLRTATAQSKLAEAALCALRSIFLTTPLPVHAISTDISLLKQLTCEYYFI